MAKLRSAALDREHHLLVREKYVPWFLVKLANGMTRGASRTYLRLFGVGIVEWRIISMLAIEPGLSAQRICDMLEMDKASVSRSVRELVKLELLSFDSEDKRRVRPLQLTSTGRELHDHILAVAIERERLLLKGFDKAETELLLSMLGRLEANLAAVDDHERSLTGRRLGDGENHIG